MRIARRLALFTVPVAVLAMGTAACGSSGSSSSSTSSSSSSLSPSPNALAGQDSQQIATKAVAGTEAAPSVRVAGSGTDSGQTFSLDLTLVHGKGCQGSIGEGKQGSFRLVYTNNTVYVLPDTTFYKANGAPAAVLPLLRGKYLKLKSTDSGLGSLAAICTVNSLLSKFTLDAGTAKGVMTTVNGQPVVKITDKTGSGFAYVSDTASPKLLRIQKPGSAGGEVNFTYPATPPAITAPPASQVIDGSKYGF